MKKDKIIGVLALQGSFIEHYNCIKQIYDNVIYVKTEEDLNKISGIILPGGESTAISRLLRVNNLFDPLKKRLEEGLCCFATCAGMILLAKELENYKSHLNILDIVVKRNAFGSQLSSFESDLPIMLDKEYIIPMVFIRAPYIVSYKENVKVLAKYKENVIAVRQNNVIALSFHPELTNDLTMYKYFIEMVNNN